VLFNNPLNPAGVVYWPDDLELLAASVKFDAVAICDEVWEHVIFDGRAHPADRACPACASAR
jgi:N-succinyldiaminopimelate aminotransferase